MRTDNDYFDEIQRDCENLPPQLNLQLKDQILRDMDREAKSLLNASLQAVDDAELTRLYDRATRRTMNERIMRSNKDDIIQFHHPLMDNTVWNARALADNAVRAFLYDLSNKLIQ